MKMTHLDFILAARAAKDMPELPLVASQTGAPGVKVPSRNALETT